MCPQAIVLRDKLVRQTVSVKTKKDTELGTMEARLAELQGKRDEAKMAREKRMKEAEIARSKAIALVSLFTVRFGRRASLLVPLQPFTRRMLILCNRPYVCARVAVR